MAGCIFISHGGALSRICDHTISVLPSQHGFLLVLSSSQLILEAFLDFSSGINSADEADICFHPVICLALRVVDSLCIYL